jgi:hypothetical protein
MLKCSSQVAAVVRIFGLVALAVGLTVSAQQREAQPGQPVTQIKVVPEKPTPNDEIKIELSGTFPYSCVPENPQVLQSPFQHQFTIYTTSPEQFCSLAPTKWNLTVPLGKLKEGPYALDVIFNMSKYEDPAYLIGQGSFTVQEKGSAQSDQEKGVLLRVLVVDTARTDGTWVTFPEFLAISDAGAPADKNPCSPKKTCRAHGARVSPGSDEPGVDVFLAIGVNAENTHKFVGCEFTKDVERVGNCTRPPTRPIKEIVKLKLTGPNPVFKFLLEQEALPDLTVRINALVRRYTEREQVFCDITVLTTVQNLGKGPAGVVALANNLNSRKANLLRWGMDSGAEATQVDILIRLRPGSYLLEAEVQSLSLKESNDKNNKVTQVVTCR